MATLQAKRIKDALTKAKSVGRIEEPLTIAGCEVVLQNLTPQEFEAILEEISPLEDVEYAFAYQVNHVAHSIIELNGADLRDVEFIEDEVPAGAYLVQVEVPTEAAAQDVVARLKEAKVQAQILPPDGSATRIVQVERHQWLRDNVLMTWSREALLVAWRKFMELLATADEKAKEGISFRIPDETPEERYRRLINELREASEEMPDELIDNILAEHDLIRKSSRQELDQATERLASTFQAPLQASAAPEAPTPQLTQETAPQATTSARQAPAAPPAEVQAAMAARQPLNQQGAPPVPTPPVELATQPARPKAVVPDQIRRAAQQNSSDIGRTEAAVLGSPEPLIQGGTQPAPHQPPVMSGIPTRGAQIAQLEAQVDPTLTQEPYHPGRAELSQPQAALDSKGIVSIVDKPPVAGVNRKFKPKSRM